jgi:hypothetical protein
MTPRPFSDLHDTVFAKTAAGRAEMGERKAGLSARQRSMFIMLDGQKPLGRIDTLLPQQQLVEIVEVLLAAGLIEATTAAATVATTAPAAPQPLPVVTAPDDAELQPIKMLMTETASSYLGLMAADIVRRIDAAHTHTQLMAVLGQWHMAMRESKYGRDVAGAYLDEIKARLAQRATA